MDSGFAINPWRNWTPQLTGKAAGNHIPTRATCNPTGGGVRGDMASMVGAGLGIVPRPDSHQVGGWGDGEVQRFKLGG